LETRAGNFSILAAVGTEDGFPRKGVGARQRVVVTELFAATGMWLLCRILPYPERGLARL
jgi:hypothetical protein